jgi:hypothetical protein
MPIIITSLMHLDVWNMQTGLTSKSMHVKFLLHCMSIRQKCLTEEIPSKMAQLLRKEVPGLTHDGF